MKNETSQHEYTDRLVRLETPLWKRLLDVQAPYRWNLRRLEPGFTLDIGCGLGRNLEHLRGRGIGIDHNPFSVEVARKKGLQAYTPEEFKSSEWCRRNVFDSILLAHVLEHLDLKAATALLNEYLPLLNPNGKVIVITPQEQGQKSDPTHVEFLDFERVRDIFSSCGVAPEKQYSFPFPRSFGKAFVYNEFVSVGRFGGT